MWRNALAVFRFELRRTMTVSRIAVWLLLIMFPVFIVSVLKYHETEIQTRLEDSTLARTERQRRNRLEREFERAAAQSAAENASATDPMSGPGTAKKKKEPPSYLLQLWVFVLFGLIPEVITLFGLLLWVPAIVNAELEGRTWIYLAVRPGGRVSVLLGKYVTAITWTMAAGWISTTICVLIVRPAEAFRVWATMVSLVALACLAYGSIYSLIGVWLHRRAMVIAVAYTLICEFLVSFIPAVVNKLTVQYRLRNLLLTGMDWWDIVPSGAKTVLLGSEPAWLHLLVLAGITVGILVLALQVIQRKEYVTATEA
jgi:ABC-type transport system involved in multi-copper enzyme maturation permease subunit